MPTTVYKLYAANFLSGIVFWYATEKLFMASIGIDAVGIGINAIIYIVISLSLQIPAGILADRWSRKYMIIIGMLLLALSALIMGESHSFTMYLIGTAVWGLYMVCTEGSDQALMYDSLLSVGREKEYARHQGRSYGLLLLGISLSALAGGYIAQAFSLRTTYFLSIIPALVTIVILVTIREPTMHKNIEKAKLPSHARMAIKLLLRNQALRYLCLLFIGVTVINNSQNEYASLYYIALGFGAIGNGWATAGKWLSSSLGHFMAGYLTPYMGKLVPLFFAASVGFTFWHISLGLIVFYVASFLDSVVMTNAEAIVQDNTPSNIRATTLSVVTFVASLLLVPANLAFGLLARGDVFQAYFVSAVIGLGFGIFWMLRPRLARA